MALMNLLASDTVLAPLSPAPWKISDTTVLDVLESIPSTAKEARTGPRPFPHPFPARMPPEVARAIVGGMSAKGDCVLDPMVGSGTTAAAALSLGRSAMGYDSDPLAVLLANARCKPPPAEALASAITRVSAAAKQRVAKLGSDDLSKRFPHAEDRAFLDRWFPSQTQLRLLALIESILTDKEEATRPSLIALFSSTIITKQGGVTSALDVSRSRAHYSTDKQPADAFREWDRRAGAFIRHAKAVSAVSPEYWCNIGLGDARALPASEAEAMADLILTSPPYLDAIDYMRASRFTLVWLENTLASLRDTRRGIIGWQRSIDSEDVPDGIEEMVSDCPAIDRRKPMLRQYLVDMLKALREARRRTKRGGWQFMWWALRFSLVKCTMAVK